MWKMVVHTCNPISQEIESVGLFEASLGYTAQGWTELCSMTCLIKPDT